MRVTTRLTCLALWALVLTARSSVGAPAADEVLRNLRRLDAVYTKNGFAVAGETLTPADADAGVPAVKQAWTMTVEGARGALTHEVTGERPTVAVTNWTGRSELFMEYPVLVAGEGGRFAIHVTDLSDFSPLTTGEAVVVLRGSDGKESEFRGGISRPGIFGADVTPVAPGMFDFNLRVETAGLRDAPISSSFSWRGARFARTMLPFVCVDCGL